MFLQLLIPRLFLQSFHRVIYKHRTAERTLGIFNLLEFVNRDFENLATFLFESIFSTDHGRPRLSATAKARTIISRTRSTK